MKSCYNVNMNQRQTQFTSSTHGFADAGPCVLVGSLQ